LYFENWNLFKIQDSRFEAKPVVFWREGEIQKTTPFWYWVI